MASRRRSCQHQKPFPFLQLPTELQAWIADLMVMDDSSITLLGAPLQRVPAQTEPVIDPSRPFASDSHMMLTSRAVHTVYCDAIWRRLLGPDFKIKVGIRDLQFGAIIRLLDAWTAKPSMRTDRLRAKLTASGSLTCQLSYNEPNFYTGYLHKGSREDHHYCKVSIGIAVAATRWFMFCRTAGIRAEYAFDQRSSGGRLERRVTSVYLSMAFGDEIRDDTGELQRLWRATAPRTARPQWRKRSPGSSVGSDT